MPEIDIVNEGGYKALRNLAGRNPQLFTSPNVSLLREAMIREAGTEDVWRKPISVGCSLEPLNDIAEKGPRSDEHYAKIVRQALADISLADATDELLWASINCFAIADYVPRRWETSNIRNTDAERFVDRHWLKGGPSGRQDNAIARLWWLDKLSERVSQHSKHSADALLNVMANNVNLYHQTLSRPYLLANPRLVAAIYEVAMDGNTHLYQTKHASDMFKSLNVRAGATALDLMGDDDLRDVVKAAVPPKEQATSSD